MCTIFTAYKAHSRYALIVAANRDEFYNRPTKSAHWWMESGILAGKDLQGGGTWLGVNKLGKFSCLTNYRDIKDMRDDARSRGELITDFLTNDFSPLSYLDQIAEHGNLYNGFNLLTADLEHGLAYYSNKSGEPPVLLENGIYAVSNHLLDTPWPKVWKNRILFEDMVENNDTFPVEAAFQMLANPEIAEDDELPSTGVSLEWERMLSAIWIQSPNYGTRVSTVLTIDYEGNVDFEERSFELNKGNRKFQFRLKNKVVL
ncbi:MAG: NRDE family protein [Bacteroidia bacterium]